MRKLAIASCAFSAAVVLANQLVPAAWKPWTALLFVLAGLALLLPRRRWLRAAILAALAFGAGMAWSWLYGLRTTARAEKLDGQTIWISGELLDAPERYDRYDRLTILPEGENLSGLRCLLYDHDRSAEQARAGDRIQCRVKLRRADLRYGEEYDGYLSRGIYLTGSVLGPVQTEKRSPSLRALPARIAERLLETVDRLFPEDTAGFFRSLILGEKSRLYEDTGLYYALSRAGMMHVAAVSGMHVAFLVSLLQFLLGRRRGVNLGCILLIWLFVLMCGASPSAVRAGIMQTLLLAAPLADREYDPFTALSAALALILLLNPYAASSVSLQLSFAAVAGIIAFSRRIQARLNESMEKGNRQRLGAYLHGTAAISLGVLIFSLPISAWHFGYVSLLSPLTNLLCLWAVSLCFCGALFACALGALIPAAGQAVAWLVSWLARYLFLVCRLIVRIPGVVVTMESVWSIPWLLLCYLLLALLLTRHGKMRWRALIPAACALASLYLTMGLVAGEYRALDGVFTAIDVGQGQGLAVLSGENTLLIDCGSIGERDNAGERVGAYLLSRGRRHADALILTHLHEDHANGVPMLLEMVQVDRILLARDCSREEELWETVSAAAEAHGTRIEVLSQDTQLSFGRIAVRLFMPADLGDQEERCLSAAVSVGDYDMLVTGDLPKIAEKELLRRINPEDMELLIVGHHGSRFSCSGELLNGIGAESAIISVGSNNYGHPTGEVLERLAAYGCTIYRTDCSGTVEIRIG